MGSQRRTVPSRKVLHRCDMENFRESAALLHGSQNRCLRSDRCESGSLLDQILTAMRKSRDEEGKRNRYHDTKPADAVPYRRIDDLLGLAGFSCVRVDLRVPRQKKLKPKDSTRKDRCRYSRKRTKCCRNFYKIPTRPPVPAPGASSDAAHPFF